MLTMRKQLEPFYVVRWGQITMWFSFPTCSDSPSLQQNTFYMVKKNKKIKKKKKVLVRSLNHTVRLRSKNRCTTVSALIILSSAIFVAVNLDAVEQRVARQRRSALLCDCDSQCVFLFLLFLPDVAQKAALVCSLVCFCVRGEKLGSCKLKQKSIPVLISICGYEWRAAQV